MGSEGSYSFDPSKVRVKQEEVYASVTRLMDKLNGIQEEKNVLLKSLHGEASHQYAQIQASWLSTQATMNLALASLGKQLGVAGRAYHTTDRQGARLFGG